MSAKKATDAAVFAVANELIAKGIEPSIVEVRNRTLGSYSTVEAALDRFHLARAEAPPPEFTAKADTLVRLLWGTAKQQAEAEVREARAAADAHAKSARADLSYAQTEIRRLEEENGTTEQQLSKACADLERERTALREVAQRLGNLERELHEARQTGDATRDALHHEAVRAAALQAECASLKEQLSELTSLMRSWQSEHWSAAKRVVVKAEQRASGTP